MEEKEKTEEYKYECPVCHIPRPFQIVHERCKKFVKIEIIKVRNNPPTNKVKEI